MGDGGRIVKAISAEAKGKTVMYVEHLSIQNFRCFGETAFDLNYPGRETKENGSNPLPRLGNVNLFVGGNGAGKSSVFKALTLAVLERMIQNSGFSADYLVRRSRSDVGKVVIESAAISVQILLDKQETDSKSSFFYSEVTIDRRLDSEFISFSAGTHDYLDSIFRNDSPAFFVVGYGANRRTERPEGYSEGSRSPRYQRVASLFEEHVGLVPFTHGALQLRESGYWNEARDLLNTLLPTGVQLTDETDTRKRPLFNRGDILLPFDALSDGFRAFVSWIWDLLYQMGNLKSTTNPHPKLTEISGVVIVDEIDLFLHPEWQRVVIEQVAETFPHLQFLFSSHSPLVAGTLEPRNIFVLETASDGTATVQQYDENIYGLTANQVLTSSYFGLESTRAPGTGSLSDAAARALGHNSFAAALAPTLPTSTNGTSNGTSGTAPEDLARRMLEEIASE